MFTIIHPCFPGNGYWHVFVLFPVYHFAVTRAKRNSRVYRCHCI